LWTTGQQPTKSQLSTGICRTVDDIDDESVESKITESLTEAKADRHEVTTNTTPLLRELSCVATAVQNKTDLTKRRSLLPAVGPARTTRKTRKPSAHP